MGNRSGEQDLVAAWKGAQCPEMPPPALVVQGDLLSWMHRRLAVQCPDRLCSPRASTPAGCPHHWALTRRHSCWPPPSPPVPGTHAASLLLVVVAGAGRPTPDLAPELLYQLWVLLLHLLGKLLTPVGRAHGAPSGPGTYRLPPSFPS